MLTLMTVLAATAVQAPDFTWSGDLRAGQRLEVRNIVGDVRIEPASGRRAEVVARRVGGRHGRPEDVEVEAVETRDGVRFCVYYPASRRESRPDSCDHQQNWDDDRRTRNDTRVEFEIRLPAGVGLDARTVSGSVVAREVSADATVRSVSGSVRVSGMSGGRLAAKTVSGSVHLEGIRSREVEAETVSGDVTYSGALDRDGRYDLTTLSGSVEVLLPEGSGALIEASTFSGRIRLPPGSAEESSNRRRTRMTGRVGAGGGRLHLESFSGNVEVRFGAR